MHTERNRWIAIAVVVAVLLLDQLSKIWVKTHMALYDSIDVFNWFKIYFVENNGMAFGIEAGFVACVALILAGASGNIIDSIFYGVIFDASYPGHIASMVPWGEGYSSLLHGRVVDMLYFPLFSGKYPDWVPFVGGDEFLFFRFIFNIADSAITVGVILILLFYRKTLSFSLLSQSEREKLEKEKQDQLLGSEK